MKLFCLAAQLSLATAGIGKIFSAVLVSSFNTSLMLFFVGSGPETRRVARSSRSRHPIPAENQGGKKRPLLKQVKFVLGRVYQKLWEVDLSTDELDGMNKNPIRKKL